jgi:hypothetical protein
MNEVNQNEESFQYGISAPVLEGYFFNQGLYIPLKRTTRHLSGSS